MSSIPPVSESLSTVGTDGVVANTDPDAPQNEVNPPDPITTYNRSHRPEVSYDKLHLYQPSQLAASIANFGETTRTNDRLCHLQELLRSDENSLMLHQTEMISVSDQYANILDDVDQGRTTEDSI